MAYCIYLRKSRADIEVELRGDGETLERHKSTLLILSKNMGLNVTEIYSEILSGDTIASRPVIQKVLAEVGAGMWEGVIVMEVERLARGDTIDQGIVSQAFKYSGTKIITPTKVYDPNNEFDEEYFEFGLFMSRREYKVINRRLKSGRIKSVNEGKFVGNIAPYGYTRYKLPNTKGFSLKIVQEEADIVKQIFSLFTIGDYDNNGALNRLGMSLIIRKLNDLKIPPRKSDAWTISTIRCILTNPIYIGKIRWNYRAQVKKVVEGHLIKERPRANNENVILADGLHEKIISEQTWNVAQELINKNPSKPCPHDFKIKNPLAGIVICGFCGRKMVRRPYNNGYPDSLMCPQTSCKNVSAQLYIVEQQLLTSLESWLNNYKFDFENFNTDESTNISNIVNLIGTTIKKSEEELKNTQKQLNKLHDLLEQGVYDTHTFLSRSKVLVDRQNELLKIITTCETEKNQAQSRNNMIKIVIPKIQNIIELYRLSDDAAVKNEFLRQILDKVIYTKKVGGRWHNDPYDFELDLFPLIPNK